VRRFVLNHIATKPVKIAQFIVIVSTARRDIFVAAISMM
jgi:hypothetical protein